jgi:hypothetical protein
MSTTAKQFLTRASRRRTKRVDGLTIRSLAFAEVEKLAELHVKSTAAAARFALSLALLDSKGRPIFNGPNDPAIAGLDFAKARQLTRRIYDFSHVEFTKRK